MGGLAILLECSDDLTLKGVAIPDAGDGSGGPLEIYEGFLAMKWAGPGPQKYAEEWPFGVFV